MDMLRYSRTIAVPGIGEEGQQRLCDASVLVVGAGALGSVVALYLAGAGVGHIGLADFDTIDISNLQRQIAYAEDQAGERKVAALAARLRALNTTISVTEHPVLVTARNAATLFADYSHIADCTDNPSTKHLMAALAQQCGKPCVTAGVSGFTAQVFTTLPGAPSYNDMFGEPDRSNPAGCPAFAPCGADGVVGPAAGVAATCQCTELIKLITGAGEPLSHPEATPPTASLFTIDLRTFATATLTI